MNTAGTSMDKVLSDYIQIEHKIENLLIVLDSLKDHYNTRTTKETYAAISVITDCLLSIQTDFSKTITKMDLCIMEEREKWQHQELEEVEKKF